MLNLRLRNEESILIPKEHPIYMWSSVLQSKKERNNPKLNLKKYNKSDIELVIRIVELLAFSKNINSFFHDLNVLSAAMNESQIKSALSLIHILHIVPPPDFFVEHFAPNYTLANYIAPLMVFSSRCYSLANKQNKQVGGGTAKQGGVNPLVHLM